MTTETLLQFLKGILQFWSLSPPVYPIQLCMSGISGAQLWYATPLLEIQDRIQETMVSTGLPFRSQLQDASYGSESKMWGNGLGLLTSFGQLLG